MSPLDPPFVASNDPTRMRATYNALRDEHERLDREIAALEALGPGVDRLSLQRLKKRKLQLKEKITALSRWLEPNIIA